MPPPIRIGPFELVAPIGRGGMGRVWEARHQKTGLPVALKVASGRGDSEELEARLRNELRAVVRFHHPCVVQVYDFGRIDALVAASSDGQLEVGSPYLVMELVRGGRLDDLSIDSWSVLRTVIVTLLEALAHVHACGVVHRDLKPANVLLGERRLLEGEGATHAQPLPLLKLADFGVAMDYQQPPAHVVVEAVAKGTPSYMAPEVIKGVVRDQGPWTDLYALGCLVHQLAAGRPPFVTDDLEQLLRCHLHVPAPPIEPGFPVPADFGAWVGRLLSKAPRERFRWAAEASHALLSLRGELAGSTVEPSTDHPDGGKCHIHGGVLEDATTRVEIPVQQVTDDLGGVLAPSQAAPLRVPVSWRRTTPTELRVRLDGAGLGLLGLRDVPLIGRETERSTLWRALRQVQSAQRARAIVLQSSAGFGKTALARWLSRRVRELGLAIVLDIEHDRAPGASRGFGSTLAKLLRCTGLAPEQMRERARRFVDSYGLLARDVDALVELMSESDDDATDETVPTVEPAQRHFTLLRRLLAALGSERPVLICVDDAQWAPRLIEFIHHILEAQAVVPLPVLIVLTANEDDLYEEPEARALMTNLLRHPDARPIQIGRMAPGQVAELFAQLLPIDRALVARFVDRVDGNPGLAATLVRDATARSVWQGSGWGFTIDPCDPLLLPETPRAHWSKRLSRLTDGNDDTTKVLELAAAIGSTVDATLWRRAAGRLKLRLETRLTAKLVEAHVAGRQRGGWRFRQPALRVALEQQARERGRWERYHACLHACLHDGLKSETPGAAEAELAYHLLEAGRFVESLEPLWLVAEHSRDRGDYPGALLQLVRRERALLELDRPKDDPERLHTQVSRAHLGALVGELHPARERLKELESRALAAELRDVVGAARAVLGLVSFWSGDLDGAREAFEGAADRLADLGDKPGHVRCLRGLAEIAKRRGDWAEARELYRRATSILGNTGRGIDRAATLAGYADLLARTGARKRALELVREAQKAYRLAGSRHGELAMSNNVGDLLREAGDLDGAERHYQHAMVELTEIGALEARIAEINLGLVRLARGEVDAAGRYFERVLGALRSTGATNLIYAWAGLLSVHARRREWSRWDVALAEVSSRVADGSLLDVDLAWLLERAGDEAEASGEPERADLPWSLAHAQWVGLGRAERAEVLAERVGLESARR